MNTKGNGKKGKRKKISKKTIWKRVGVIIGILVLFLVVAVGAMLAVDASRIKERFGMKITVNGRSVWGKTAKEAAEEWNEEFQEHPVSVKENGEEICRLTLGEAGYSLDTEALAQEFENIIDSQKPELQIFKKTKNKEVTYKVLRSEETFASAFTAEKVRGEREDSADAYVNYDAEQGKFVIIPEVNGNKISDSEFQKCVENALQNVVEQRDLPEVLEVEVDDTIYIKPNITSQQEDLVNQMNSLNGELDSYRGTTITYQFGDTTEQITSDMICSWLTVEGLEVKLSEEPVRDFISQLASKYNTIYRERNFKTSTGETVKLEHNEYGYQIDQEAEFQQVMTELNSGKEVNREPVYKKEGYKRNGTDDLTGNYVEVSIEKQHLWLYKDGQLVTETDVVTGTPKEETATYKGAWPIAYKASPYTLSSDFYGYEVKVNYWMPFVYGQGLHDLERSEYGGEIYKTNGSHGCVNLPLEQAKIIYETVAKGFPIILY